MTHILVTNDDGVNSPGLLALKQALEPLGRVSVIAPDGNRSAIGRGITIHNPLHVEEVRLADGSPALATDGTPVDCVRFATLGLLGDRPDVVVSGINLGMNLGDDVTYSGTVAAALEGILLGWPAIAVSAQAVDQSADQWDGTAYDFRAVARFTAQLVPVVSRATFPRRVVLNVNAPGLPPERVTGASVTRLGQRIYNDELDPGAHRGHPPAVHDLRRQRDLPAPGGHGLRRHRAGRDLGHAAALRSHRPRRHEPAGADVARGPAGPPRREEQVSARQGFDPILLDLDGTVIDSVALIRESHRHAVREVLGEDWPDDRLVANVGRPLQEQMQVFSPQHSDELYRVYREWNHANTSALLLAYAGVEEALRELRDAGRRLGIVTSKSRDAVDLAWGVLPHLGELFDVVIAAEDTARHKPDAAPVLEALARLGGTPSRACYVGDAPFDIQAGRAAGVVTIAVTWGFFTLPDLEAEEPDRVVATPEELVSACLGRG